MFKLFLNTSLEEEGFEIIEFGHDGVYESHEITIENGDVVVIDEYICPFFKIPNKVDDEVSNYSIIIVVRSLSDVDGNAWWLLSHKHGYRSIDVGDVMDAPIFLESAKRNKLSLSLKFEVDEFNRGLADRDCQLI